MTDTITDLFFNDNGGRRRIKDRRYRVEYRQEGDRRTGLKRRCGWDRRIRQTHSFTGADRRIVF